MTATTRFLCAQEVKHRLAAFIPARYVSVRTRWRRRQVHRARGQVTSERSSRVEITVRREGTAAAWERRVEIEAAGFTVTFYGECDRRGQVVRPTSVQIATR